MNVAEAAAALTLASSADNRTVTESAARMWANILADVRIEDAKVAIPEHYTRTSDFLMPAHIIDIVKEMRRARTRDMATPVPPESIDPDDTATERAWIRAYTQAIGDGHDEATADRVACATVNVTRPHLAGSPLPVAPVIEAFAKTGLRRVPPRANSQRSA